MRIGVDARSLLAAAVVAAVATGCGDDAPKPPEKAPVQDPVAPGDVLGQEMQRRAGQFAEGMTPATPMFRGSLDNGGTQDYQAVLQGGRCFKILGVGSEGVSDLDLFLFDPNGVQVQQDTATDNYPVLGLTDPICPEQAGAYRVQVKMYAGSGEFAVRVYQSGE